MFKPATIKRMTLPIISLAVFMEAVDTTILNTAIPVMAKHLDVYVIHLKLALISYLISLAIFIPISGWLADRLGTKKVFMSAIFIFTVSSVFCGLSQSLPELVIARFFQGLGGAFMIPVGRLIVVQLFHRSELIESMNRVIAPALIGPAFGPLLGGFIVQHFSWRWIFWVNIPVGLMAFILAYYFIQDFRSTKNTPFDIIGFILFGLGLAGFAFGLSALSEDSISDFISIFIIASSVCLLILCVLHSRLNNNTDPILPLDLFTFKAFRISLTGNIFSRLGFAGVPFVLPLMLQIALKFSPEHAGAMLAMVGIGGISAKFISKKLLHYSGFRHYLVGNTILLGAMLWLFLLVNNHTPLILIIALVFLYGFISSLQYSAMNPLAYADVPAHYSSRVSSLVSVAQQVSTSCGVAVCALLLKYAGALNLLAFHRTFFILGVITLLAAGIFLELNKEDGRDLIVH